MKKKWIKAYFKANSVNEDNYTLDGIFSTPNEDRHGDKVMQSFDLKSFKKNPVILNSHRYDDATEVIGRAEKIGIKDGKLQGKIKFAVNESEKAKIIFQLIKGGFLNAFSIGFMPIKFNEKDPTIIEKSELLEVSVVSVPANSEALAKAKAKGINIDKLYGKSNIKNIKDKESDGDTSKTNSDNSKIKREKSDEKARGDGRDGENKIKKAKSVDEEGKLSAWYEGENIIIYRERAISEFEDGLIKMVIKPTSPKVLANVGILKNDLQREKVIQSYIFPREEGWTIDDTKKWIGTKIDDDLFLGKNIKKEDKKKDLYNAIKEYNDSKLRALAKVNKALKIISEETKGETRTESVRAESKRLINKAIRQLIKIKKE